MDSFKPLIKGISSTPRSLQWNHFSYKTSDEFGTNQRTQSVSFWPRLRSMTKPQLLAVRCGEWGIFAGNKKNSPSLICMSLWTPFSRILTQASPTKFKNQSYKMNSLSNTDLNTFDLVKELLSLFDMVIFSVIWSPNKHDHKLPIVHELITNRWKERSFIFFDPLWCICYIQSRWHYEIWNIFGWGRVVLSCLMK